MALIAVQSHHLPPWYRFARLHTEPLLDHVLTTRLREPGASADATMDMNSAGEQHHLLARMLGCPHANLVACQQVHGTAIQTVDSPVGVRRVNDVDGLMTATPGIGLVIRVADCVPLLLYSPEIPALVVVHAGWRGTLQGIAGRAVARLAQTYGCQPGLMRAGIGPSIGPCCFKVGAAVADAFIAACGPRHPCIWHTETGCHIDLGGCIHQQLTDAGLDHENIETAGLCTACNSDIFFSHRREQGKTGRFVLAAILRCGTPVSKQR